jgi:hypothetical protein
MTPGVKKALRIFLDHGGPLTPTQFARRYFPADHPGSKQHQHESHRGRVLWAGGFIGKLRRAGLVEACGDLFAVTMYWRLTYAGRKAAGT